MNKKLFSNLQVDPGIWIALIFLVLLTSLIVRSTAGEVTTVNVPHSVIKEVNGKEIRVEASEKKVITTNSISKHITFIIIAFIVIACLQNINPFVFFRIGQVYIYVAWILLLYTLIAGKTIGDATRWIKILGLTIQTSEIAKIALVMFIAQYLSFYQGEKRAGRNQFIYLMVHIFVTCVLIVTENFSTAAIIFITALTIMFIGRIPLKYFIYSSLFAVAACVIFIGFGHSLNITRAKTWQSRIYEHSNIDCRITGRSEEAPWLKKKEANPNKLTEADHVSLAIYDAGTFGRGLGKSKHKDYLGAASSDYIYTIIIEEGGILIWLPVLFLYLFIIYRSGIIVYRSRSAFCSLLVIGCVLDISIQAFINMAVGSSLFPITGQTLPFVSMGGTSMLINSAPALGMILSVGRYSKIQRDKEKANAVQTSNSEVIEIPDENNLTSSTTYNS